MSGPRTAPSSTPAYRRYMSSSGWRSRRAAFRGWWHANVGEWMCWSTDCHETTGLDTHHVTYERLGNECNSDLRPLCRRCHAAVTAAWKRLERAVCLRWLTEVMAGRRAAPAPPGTHDAVRARAAAAASWRRFAVTGAVLFVVALASYASAA